MECVFSFPRYEEYSRSFGCFPCENNHHIVKLEGEDGSVFFLQCAQYKPRLYIKSVALPKEDVGGLLMREIFSLVEEAVTTRSSWTAGLVKEPLQLLMDVFPGLNLISDDFLVDFCSRVKMLEDVQQSLKEQSIDYERVLRSAVFPKKAISPKLF